MTPDRAMTVTTGHDDDHETSKTRRRNHAVVADVRRRYHGESTMIELARWREEFPILARTTYMISNSLGAMPRRTAAYLPSTPTRGRRAGPSMGTSAGGKCLSR
jgi:hypothetical protein